MIDDLSAMARYYYDTAGKRVWRKLKPEARRMRREPTPGEDALWRALRGGKLGIRFRRQHAIDRFIVEFVCLPAKLIIEVDGGSHETTTEQDKVWDAALDGAGYAVVRYTNAKVLGDIEAVIDNIQKNLRDRLPPKHPSPRLYRPKAWGQAPGGGCCYNACRGCGEAVVLGSSRAERPPRGQIIIDPARLSGGAPSPSPIYAPG